MTSFADCPIDSNAILGDIERIVRIESPTSDPAGVNRVLDVIAAWFEGTGAQIERSRIDDRLGDLLCVRCHPGQTEPGILVLSHVDTVHPVGTLAQALPYRREGDKVYGPGIYDMKGGLVLAIAAFQRLARAKINLPLPITFLFNPDEEVGSVGIAPLHRGRSRSQSLRAGDRAQAQRRQDRHASARGRGASCIRTHGRPAHSGGSHEKGRSAIRAMAAHHPADRGLHRLRARHHHQRRAGQRRNRRQRDPGVLHHRGRRARLRPGCGGRDGAEVCVPSSRATRISRSA